VQSRPITVVGAGILGLWQTLTLARRGHTVRLIDAAADPFAASASSHAGAMLAPDCEREAAPPVVRDLGHHGLALWRAVYPHLFNAGSLVLAQARDLGELTRFSRMTGGYEQIDGERLASLEPDLAGRFGSALFFPAEAHMATPVALRFLAEEGSKAGAEMLFGEAWHPGERRDDGGIVVDCRGLGARGDLPDLRGVRGERMVLRSREINLQRPVRLLHPRHPIYVVPWGDGRFLLGATVIESEDAGPATVRSALELLGTAYALHPAFGEAEIVEIGSGVRPAYADNVPRAIVRDSGKTILVNGAYRHGFLLGPVLAEAVANLIDHRSVDHPLLRIEA
jgi:glycine oxidase